MTAYTIHHESGASANLTAIVTPQGGLVVRETSGTITRRVTPAYVTSKGGPREALEALYRRTSADRFWWKRITAN